MESDRCNNYCEPKRAREREIAAAFFPDKPTSARRRVTGNVNYCDNNILNLAGSNLYNTQQLDFQRKEQFNSNSSVFYNNIIEGIN